MSALPQRLKDPLALQCPHAGVQTRYIKSVDDEGAVATLGAARPTREPLAGAVCGVGQRGIHNLHELGVVHWQTHPESISEADVDRTPMDFLNSAISIGNFSCGKSRCTDQPKRS